MNKRTVCARRLCAYVFKHVSTDFANQFEPEWYVPLTAYCRIIFHKCSHVLSLSLFVLQMVSSFCGAKERLFIVCHFNEFERGEIPHSRTVLCAVCNLILTLATAAAAGTSSNVFVCLCECTEACLQNRFSNKHPKRLLIQKWAKLKWKWKCTDVERFSTRQLAKEYTNRYIVFL